MSFSRSSIHGGILLSSLALVCCSAVRACAAEPKDASSADVVVSDSTDFTVPAGNATELLAFIEKLANPQDEFADKEALGKYLDGVSVAIGEAADQILAGDAGDATDRQLIDAIEWKMESLRIRRKLGDADSDKQTDEFLAGLKFDSRPSVEKAVAEIRQNHVAMQQQIELMTRLRQWQRLDPAQRAEATDWLINTIKSGPSTAVHASMLMIFSEELSRSPDAELAKKALAELLPVLSKSGNPGVEDLLPRLEGVERRLNLLGNTMELSGTFLDGAKLDWDEYRGKVVLVDFWATWCGPCRAEVPNILENYLKYHDKGFDVIGISLDDTRADAEEYIKQTNIPWPTLFPASSEETGWQNPLAVKYGVTGIPTTILIDKEGKVVSVEARGPRLGAELEKLLGKPSGDETSAVEISDQVERTARSEPR